MGNARFEEGAGGFFSEAPNETSVGWSSFPEEKSVNVSSIILNAVMRANHSKRVLSSESRPKGVLRGVISNITSGCYGAAVSIGRRNTLVIY